MRFWGWSRGGLEAEDLGYEVKEVAEEDEEEGVCVVTVGNNEELID